MMSRLIQFALLLLLTSCVSSDRAVQAEHLTSYDDIESYVGKQVSLSGIISRSHGASGIYFNQKDVIETSDRCVAVTPFPPDSHGQNIYVSGVLTRTDCGTKKICTNICSTYRLVRNGIK